MSKHAVNAVLGLVVLAMCIALVSGAAAGRRVIASTDHVPLGDWTYDAMISLASDGLVPKLSARVFQGDRLFDRIEMAQVVASIVESSEETNLGCSRVALIDHLVSEFKPELVYLDEGIIQKWSERATNISLPTGEEAFLLGYARGLATDDRGDADGEADEAPFRVSGFLNLSDRVFGIATAADKEDKFFHEFRDDPTLDKAFLRGFDSNFVWSIGREYLNWGPAYTGSLILSDNSPALIQVRAAKEIDFGKLFGRVKITQFVSTFEDNDQSLYLFGRRYEKRLSDRWHAGISETAKVSDTPNPLILVLPFYLYQHIFIDIDEEFNTLYAADLSYRTRGGCELYGELVVDDITQPRIFGRPKYDRPRKTGWTVGFYTPKLFGGERPSNFRAEYIFVDRLTYEATRADFPELAYTQDGDIIGHPIGANANALYLRGEQYLSDKLSIIAEYLSQRQTESGAPERGRKEILSLTAAYDIAPDKSIAVRVAPYDIVTAAGVVQDGTKYEVRASFAF